MTASRAIPISDPASPAVHVVGNACVDTAMRVRRFPLAGETLVATSAQIDLGGKGLNQAVAAARTGAKVHLWASVGADEAGASIRLRVGQEGIAADGLLSFSATTDQSTILVDDRGENLIVSVIHCAAAFDPLGDGALEQALRAGDFLLMQGNLSPEVTENCLMLARTKGAVTIFNPSPIAQVAAMPWPQVDWVILNRGEAEMLTEKADPEASSRRLLAMGVGAVIVTLGAQGALLADHAGIYRVAASQLPVMDTAGAGDVVCGIFAGLLAQGRSTRDALDVAIAAGSLSVARAGTHQACPTAAEIAELAADILLKDPSHV